MRKFHFSSRRTTQPAYRTNLFICHNCKQPGHIKTQCPHLPVSLISKQIQIRFYRTSFFYFHSFSKIPRRIQLEIHQQPIQPIRQQQNLMEQLHRQRQ